MGENETSTAARVDGQPTPGVGKATGHPMDAALRRVFKGPRVTLAGEWQMIRAAMERRRMIAGSQPAHASKQGDGDVDDDESEKEGKACPAPCALDCTSLWLIFAATVALPN